MRTHSRVHDYGAIRVETLTDFAPVAPVWDFNPSTQLMETRASLTWVGRRRYDFADGPKIVLRRFEQVNSPGHVRTLRRLVVTHGHPMHRGKPINITRDNAERFQAGMTGDDVSIENVHGFQLPVAGVTITSARTTRVIQDGATQTSLGYTAMIDATGGVWDGPDPGPFDLEHVLDPCDPRVLELVEETKNDEHPFFAESLGGNHFAAALRHGRGAVLSELMAPVHDSQSISAGWLAHATQAAQGATSRRSQVFMYRDAAGIAPESEETPTEDQKMSRKIVLAVDGLNVVRREVDVDEELFQAMTAFLRELGVKTSEFLAEIDASKAEAAAATEQVATAETAQGAAEEGQAVAVAETAEMQDSLTKAKAKIVKLEADFDALVNPSDELVALRETAKQIHDADYSRLSEEAVKRTAVAGKSGDEKHAADKDPSPMVVVDALWGVYEKTAGPPAARKRGQTPPPQGQRFNHGKQPTRRERDDTSGQTQGKGRALLDKINNTGARA